MNDLGNSIQAFAEMTPWRGEVPEGYFPNFRGVMTEDAFVASHPPSNQSLPVDDGGRQARAPGITEGELFFEQLAIQKAVRSARDRFTMIELGGGYAARCVDAFTALGRENPMPSLFVLVEAEPTHFQWARRHMAANGMDPDAQWLINALVGVDEGPRLFMVGEGFYGNAAVSPEEIDQVVRNMASPEETATVLRNLLRGGRCGLDISYHTDIGIQFFDYGFVNTVALPDILTPLDRVDLIDIDIQGAEAEVIPAAMAELDRKVGRVQLASHGGAIHRGMWDLFFEHEWDCEVDFTPSSRHQTEWGSFDTEDGILHFVNPRLEG